MAEDKMLQEAIQAAERGERARARELLTRLLRTDKDNPTYWIYMSAVVEARKERLYCLETALKLDPDNELAKRGLAILGARPPGEEIHYVRPVREGEWDIGKIPPPQVKATHKDTRRPTIQSGQLLKMIGVGIAAFALIYLAIFGNPFAKPQSLYDTGLPQIPLVTSGPTATYLPTNTPRVRTPTPTFDGPTPLVYLLESTYTPTPRYVNTPHPNLEAYRSAMQAYDREKWTSVITFLEQMIELDTRSADVYYHLGQAYLQLEKPLQAAKAFQIAIDLDPGFGAAYLGLAQARQGTDPEGIVIDELNQAIALDPNLGEAYIQRGIYRLGRDNPEGALGDFAAAEALSPNSAVLYLNEAKALLQLERNEEALEAAQRSYDIDITILDTYWVLGQALALNERYEDAIGPLQIYLLFSEEDADAWLLLGRAQFESGYYENAVAVLSRALELDGKLYEVNYYRGASYLELEDYENAIHDLQNAVRIFPNWFEARLALGRAIFSSGNEGSGYLTINAATGYAKTDEQKAALYYWRGLALEAIGEEERGLNDFLAMLALPREVVPEEWVQVALDHLSEAGIDTPTPTITLTPTVTPTPTRTPTATATP